jgi:hypothetical protein
MASKIIGRANCPECGFESAHIKESDKCLYRYCPSCGTNGPHARTELQRRNMLAKTRLIEPAATPTPPTPTQPTPTDAAAAPATPTVPTPTVPTPTKVPPPAPAPAKRSGLFGF